MIRSQQNGATRVPTKQISREAMDKLFSSVGQKLRAGLSGEAEKTLRDAIRTYRHTPDDAANLKRLLSFTLETAGKYKEALQAVADYENEARVAELGAPTQIRVRTQLAIAFSNAGEQPRPSPSLKTR